MSSRGELDTVRSGNGAIAETVSGESAPQQLDASGIRRGQAVGRYVVLERLGAGAMGVVLAAYDPQLDRKVAIKVLRGSGLGDSGQRARLMREAKALARLMHPNVVSVFDVGSHENAVFVAMEYIEGSTLLETMQRWHEDPPPWRTIVEIFARAGRGLAAAHDAGIVHRDFKPANVMVSNEGRVVVLDFGLARESELAATPTDGSARDTGPNLRLTQTGTLLGTPAYMSPEQLGRGSVGPASDQYSFCVTLYEALCGERPFPAQTLRELLDSVLSRRVETVDSRYDIPEHVRNSLLRGLQRDPQRRFSTMHELVAALAPQRSRSHRKGWVVAGVALAVSTGAVGWSMLQDDEEESCEGVGDEVGLVWGPEESRRLRERFEDVEGDFGVEVAGIVGTRLDEYAARWSKGRAEVCEARAEATGEEFGLVSRQLCYERSLAALEAWVDLGLAADELVILRAAESIRTLPALSLCESETANSLASNLLEDATLRGRWQQIQAQLERAATLAEFEQMDAVGSELQAALEASKSLGATGLESRAWIQLSRWIIKTGGEQAEALEAARTAVLRAETSGDDERLINALRNLAFLAGVQSVETDEGLRTLDRLDATIARTGGDRVLRKHALILRARTLQRGRRWQDALEAYRSALAVLDGLDAAFDDEDLSLLTGLVTTASHVGSLDEAERAARRALALSTEYLGEGHPRSAIIEVSFGQLESARGNHASALASYRRAASIFEARGALQARNLPAVRHHIAGALRALGRPEEAAEVYELVLKEMTAAVGPGHVDVGSIHTNLGLVLAGLERYDEALLHLREALAIRRDAAGPGDPQTFFSAMNLGEALVEHGALEEAEALYERADRWRVNAGGEQDPLRSEIKKGLGEVALHRESFSDAAKLLAAAIETLPSETEALVRGDAYFAYARALWGQGKLQDARKAAKTAIELLEDHPRAETTGLPEVRAWLAERSE